MSTVREICWCGHHKDTHHEGNGPCSGTGCNVPSSDWGSPIVTSPCESYRSDREPDTIKPPKPHHPPRYQGGVLTPCGCYECRRTA